MILTIALIWLFAVAMVIAFIAGSREPAEPGPCAPDNDCPICARKARTPESSTENRKDPSS